MSIVGDVGAVDDALEVFVREEPDIILLDIGLGTEEALDLLNEIRSTSIGARVILLSGELDPEIYRSAIGAGAKGLIQMHAEPECLFKAINKVHAGEVWLDRSLMADVIDQMANHGHNSKPASRQDTPIESLSQRELEVVRLVCEGLRNKQIAERLLISESTVRHHLTSIFNKLNLTDRFQLVLHAFRNGIVQPLLLVLVLAGWAGEFLDTIM
jgi:DNA-binding NarL/FixJ family response regulator